MHPKHLSHSPSRDKLTYRPLNCSDRHTHTVRCTHSCTHLRIKVWKHLYKLLPLSGQWDWEWVLLSSFCFYFLICLQWMHLTSVFWHRLVKCRAHRILVSWRFTWHRFQLSEACLPSLSPQGSFGETARRYLIKSTGPAVSIQGTAGLGITTCLQHLSLQPLPALFSNLSSSSLPTLALSQHRSSSSFARINTSAFY